MAPRSTDRAFSFAPDGRRGNGTADSRGSIPHITYEQAEAEGRRLNAPRYETVQQADTALARNDARYAARRESGLPPMGGMDDQPPPAEGGFWGAALLVALGAGLAYVALRSDPDEKPARGARELDEDDVPAPPAPRRAPRAPRVNPAPSAPPITIVMPPQAAQASSVTVPVVVPAPIEAKPVKTEKRRRTRKPKVVPVTVELPAPPSPAE